MLTFSTESATGAWPVLKSLYAIFIVIMKVLHTFNKILYGLWCNHSKCFNLTMLSPALFLSAWSSPEYICSDFAIHPPFAGTLFMEVAILLRRVLMSIPLWFISLFLWRGLELTATLTNSGRFPKRGVPFYCVKRSGCSWQDLLSFYHVNVLSLISQADSWYQFACNSWSRTFGAKLTDSCLNRPAQVGAMPGKLIQCFVCICGLSEQY